MYIVFKWNYMFFKQLTAIFAFAAFGISAALAQNITTTLHFQDGSLEICPTINYTINYLTLDIDIVNCKSDQIFHNGFESAPLKLKDSR